MAPGSWDKGCDHPDKIVIHVAWIPERRRGSRHHRRDLQINRIPLGVSVWYQLICLREAWGLNMRSIHDDPIKRRIIQNNDTIRLFSKSFQS